MWVIVWPGGDSNGELAEHVETVSLAVENLLLIATTLSDSQIKYLKVLLVTPQPFMAVQVLFSS